MWALCVRRRCILGRVALVASLLVAALLSTVRARQASSQLLSAAAQERETGPAHEKGTVGATAAGGVEFVGAGGCSWAPPAACAPQWKYKGQDHQGCCTADSSDGKGWCSNHESYAGNWSGCAWTCEKVPGGGTVIMPFANDWVPSAEEIAHLENEVQAATKAQDGMAGHEDEEKAYQAKVKVRNDAATSASEATKKLKIAKQLAAEEDRRVAALPSLAYMAQEQAVMERQKRLEAERQLLEVRQKRGTDEKKSNDTLASIRQEIDEQRKKNREQAAEQARQKVAALNAARQAKEEVKCEKERKQKEDAALASASQAIVDATMAVASKLAEAEVKRASDVASVKTLKQQAEASRQTALEAEKKASADQASLGELDKGNASMNAKKASNAEETAVENAKAQAKLAVTAKHNAESAQNASLAAAEDLEKQEKAALKSLHAAAQDVGDSAADCRNSSKQKNMLVATLAQAAPEAFIAGVGDSGKIGHGGKSYV